jgi:hypothetical protein
VGALLLALVAGMLAGRKALTAVLAADNALVRRLVGMKAGLKQSAIRVRALVLLVLWSATSWLLGALCTA